VLIVKAASRDDLERAFDEMAVQRIGAFMVMEDPFFGTFAKRSRRLLCVARSFHVEPADCVDAGGLMSYGHDDSSVMRQIASIVDKILNGMNAGDLPIEQPTKFDLAINEKTARALKIAIPQALRLRAAKVVD
jgi:putative ABC transport system substrate-binding protein